MDEQQNKRILRRRLSRVGWGLLAYFAGAQILGSLALMLPGVADNLFLTMAVNEAVSYGLAPLALWLVIRGLPKGESQNLSLHPRAFVRTAVYSVGVLYLFSMLTSLIMAAVEQLTGHSTGDLLQSVAEDLPAWFYLVLVGILAPVFEELIFRKLLLDRLRPFGDRAAIWISGVAFGLFHMNLYQFFYAAALGLVFAGVALKTGKIWHTMLLHAIVNLSSTGMGRLAEAAPWGETAATVLMIALCILACVIFRRYARTFYHAPPQYPVTERQVMTSLAAAPGLWVCALLSLFLSIAIIFLV